MSNTAQVLASLIGKKKYDQAADLLEELANIIIRLDDLCDINVEQITVDYERIGRVGSSPAWQARRGINITANTTLDGVRVGANFGLDEMSKIRDIEMELSDKN